jgi:hypothetical protein
MTVVDEFTDYTSALTFLVNRSEDVDLVVTDVLWPSPGSPTRQTKSGLQVIRYAIEHAPQALIVALSVGDAENIAVERDARNAGAHIVRLHGVDLPGQDGAGWLELGRKIAEFISAGPPFPAAAATDAWQRERAGVVESDLDRLTAAFRRMPMSLRPLIQRRRQRSGMSLDDEYDLQDAVEAVLSLFYDDVRPEERAPSSAGSSSVIDFLVKDQSLAIEVKVASQRHGPKDLKEELLVDHHDYARHPNVRVLVTVVFDLDSAIRNVKGFESDLSMKGPPLERITIVAPLGHLRPRNSG